MNTPAFQSPRLTVYRLDYIPDPKCIGDIGADVHAAFIGIDGTSPNFAPAVTATVRLRDYWLEWIETTANSRRKGLATEILAGIERHIGKPLIVSGCTPDGERLEAAYSQRPGGTR